MKRPHMKSTLTTFLLFFSFAAVAQNEDPVNRQEQIGPKNTDMSKASSIFVIRRKDEFPNHYFGFAMDGYYGLMAKVRSEEVYEVRTLKTGQAKVIFQTDSIFSKTLDLKPYSKHYLELKVRFSHTGTPILSLIESDSATVFQYAQQLNKSILVNYSHIRYDYAEHLSSFRLKDSIQWFFDESRHFSTLKPRTVDAYTDYISASTYFFAPTASLTYSEAVNLHSIGKEKFNSEAEFRDFVANTLPGKMDGIKALSKDDIRIWDPLKDQAVSSFPYSSLVFYEVEDHNAANIGGNDYLLSRIAMLTFAVGTGPKYEVFVFTVSERGIEPELSTREELILKFTPLMNSLELHSGMKKMIISKK